MSTERFCIADYNDRREMDLSVTNFVMELKYKEVGEIVIDGITYKIFKHKVLDFTLIGNFAHNDFNCEGRFYISWEKYYEY